MGRRTARREALGAYIARARHATGQTQPELAAAVGVSARQINRWENGSAVVQKRHYRPLADALQVDYDELRDLISDARDEQYDEVIDERDAAAKERDYVFGELRQLMEQNHQLMELNRRLIASYEAQADSVKNH